ncbi:MAG: hypothetical protein AAF941_07290 [Pseudomonadota bacterium]
MADNRAEERLQAVVAKAYAAIAEPETFVPLLSELIEADEEIGGIGATADLHFENAVEILDKMYPLSASDYSALYTRANLDNDCDLAFDQDLRVVAVNRRVFDDEGLQTGQFAPEWLFDPTTEKQDQALLRSIGEDADPKFLRLHSSLEDETGRWFGVSVAVRGNRRLITLKAVRLRWSERSGDVFQQALQLTGTELALTRHLVSGGSLRQFAERRGRSIGTARNQLKALQRKLSIKSKEELLLLYAGFVHSIAPPSDGVDFAPHECSHLFGVKGRDCIAWEEFGDPQGKPILYFHPLEGALLTPVTDNSARSHGIRIIAPWRPHHGDTTGAKLGEENIREWADRLPSLLEHLRIQRCVAIAAQAGAPYMFGMAKWRPEWLIAAVSVGGFLPLKEKTDFAYLTRRQRIHIRISRVAPAFARVYMRAMLASLGTGEFYRFVEDYYEHCPRELQAVQDHDMIRIFRQSAGYALTEDHQGPVDTMLNWSADWSDLLHKLPVPVHNLVGDEDANTPPSFVEASCERYGLPAPFVVPDSGSFLLNDQPDAVMRYLLDCLD